MRLSRKKAIELCIELWTWLAKTGGKKHEWPEWEKYDYTIMNHCWFCEYQEKQSRRYKGSGTNKEGFCKYCPLTQIKVNCQTPGGFYDKWEDARTYKTRKKYAKLFLEQIKKID